MAYKNTISEALLDNFKTELKGSIVKSYFNGFIDAQLFGKSNIPALSVVKNRTEIVHGATSTDNLKHYIDIYLIVDKRNELYADRENVIGQRNLERLIEGINETTGEYEPNSILGILRRGLTLSGVIITQDGDIQYDVVQRDDESLYHVARVSIIADEHLIVSDRS